MRTPHRTSLRAALAALLSLNALAATARADETPPADASPRPIVRHLPVGSTLAGEELVVAAEVEAGDRLLSIDLHYRPQGQKDYKVVHFRRATVVGSTFTAVVPPAELLPGVVEYYIDSRALDEKPGAPPRLHVASPATPLPIIVIGDEEARWQRELLAGHLYQRSRLQLHFEWTDLGGRAGVRDDFWRLEGDYTYRLLGWIYSIRLGAGAIQGHTFYQLGDERKPLPDPQLCDLMGNSPRNYCAIGLTYGFAELRFRFGRWVRLDLKAILGAGPEHFDGGAGGQLVFGNALGSHFDIGVEGVSTLGTRGWLRLEWDTVPHVPMSLTIEVLDLPDAGDVAGRAFLTLRYRPSRYLALELLGGYGTRGWRIGGPVLGGGIAAEF